MKYAAYSSLLLPISYICTFLNRVPNLSDAIISVSLVASSSLIIYLSQKKDTQNNQTKDSEFVELEKELQKVKLVDAIADSKYQAARRQAMRDDSNSTGFTSSGIQF